MPKGTTLRATPQTVVQVRWVEHTRFDAGRPGGPTIQIDGAGIAAPNPFEAFIGALATCAATDLVLILAKQRTPVESVEIHAEAVRSAAIPRPLQSVVLHFTIAGKGITLPNAERAVELSVTRYCGVRASLADKVEVSWSIRLEGE